MPSPYSRFTRGAGVTAVASTWVSLGNLLNGFQGGYLSKVWVTSALAGGAYVPLTSVEVAMGSIGGPITTVYAAPDIQAGASWVNTEHDFTTPTCMGLEIVAAQTYLWVRSLNTNQMIINVEALVTIP